MTLLEKFLEKREEGERKNAIEIAKNAILDGLDDNVISRITKLPMEEIKKLRELLN
jgi:hypothetical protein